jgi:superoxide dismutase, Fe-Mn family
MENLPELSYEYNALEPHIDAKTMEIHHSKHHQKYIDNFNDSIQGTELEGKSAEEVLKNLEGIPEENKQFIINNGGGTWNHGLFWKVIGPEQGKMSEELKKAINENFGSEDEFKEKFSEAAKTQFGSGWAWLVVSDRKLEIIKTANQDCPLSQGKKPILCLDVWEHAYYLKYQNKRVDYIDAFWNVVNWNKVSELYKEFA